VRSKVRIPVVDLFAGPGGLSEGFSSVEDGVRFDVALSVEKDEAAHKTLVLRSFFRQFEAAAVPESYYQYLRGDITREDLRTENKHAFTAAEELCLRLELGRPRATSRVCHEIENRININSPWVLIGGPPCQAYSVVGRSRHAKTAKDEFESDERHTLYREYLKVLAKCQPSIFVLENVKGLLSAELKGSSTFESLLLDLQSPKVALREPAGRQKPATRRGGEYQIYSFTNPRKDPFELKPSDYVIEAERFGIPQRRHRVILLGIRQDLIWRTPRSLKPDVAPTVLDAIGDLSPLRSRLSSGEESKEVWAVQIRRELQGLRKTADNNEIWNRMCQAASRLNGHYGIGGRAVAKADTPPSKSGLFRWFRDSRMDFVCNHETRCHKTDDLVRYLFASVYADAYTRSPKLHQFPPSLLPNHRNARAAVALRHGHFNDRFRVQVPSEPATTVTSHMAKDGHSFIHHDVSQCRSWTVREAARTQTFPDNYFFEGFRTDQYRQVGNAVPPLLARKIGELVASIISG
jgi:DNA (cytosine-5)-methyltransferase 1